MKVTVSSAISDSVGIMLKNIPSLLGAAILWVLTCWIPYINVGTTIALFYGMPLELSRGKVMNPMSIFDAKYRKYMGEFFACVGLMSVSIIPALLFMVVPGIIISIGWCFAILLIVDKEMNPSEAMQKSTQYTYGHKWTIFVTMLVIYIGLAILAGILSYIFGLIDVSFLTFLVYLFIIVCYISVGVAVTATFYRNLVVNSDNN